MNSKTSLKQILSAGLSLAMVATSMPMPASAFGPVEATAPAFVAKLTPPEQLGYVASSFAPKGETHPRMIIISDLHSHVEVQHNIKGILEHVVGQLRGSGSNMENKTVPIFVEGGWEAHLEEPLKKVSNPVVRKFMDEYLLNKSQMIASQAYSEEVAGTGAVELTGVESKVEYLFNKAQFVKSYPARKALLSAIQNQERVLRDLTQFLTSGSFGRLQTMRDGYNAGRVRPETYAHALVQIARRNNVQSSYLNILENASTANPKDLDVAFAQVYRKVLFVVSHKRPLTAFLHQSLQNEDTIRENLAQIDASLDLLKRLIADQLTPSEIPLCLAHMGDLIQTAEILLNNSDLKEKAADTIRDSFEFYPYAQMRDISLAQNSLKALNSYGPDATGILVVGGFHTDAIADQMREKGISYIVINPTITRDMTTQEQINYVRWMGGEKIGVEEIARDVQTMRGQKSPTTATSALGVVSNTPGETTKDDGGHYAAVDVQRALGLNDAAIENLTTVLQKDVRAIASESVTSARDENAVAAVQAVLQNADGLAAPELKAMNQAVTDPAATIVTLKKGSDGQYRTVAGLQGALADYIAAQVNVSAQAATEGSKQAEGVDEIHVVVLKNGLNVMKTNAKAIGLKGNTNARVIVIDEQKWLTYMAGGEAVQKARAAEAEVRALSPETPSAERAAAEAKRDQANKAAMAHDQADETIDHELAHIFGKFGNTSEQRTIIQGWAIKFARSAADVALNNAGAGSIDAAVMAETNRVSAAISAEADGAATGLVGILSNQRIIDEIQKILVGNPSLTTANAQAILSVMESVHALSDGERAGVEKSLTQDVMGSQQGDQVTQLTEKEIARVKDLAAQMQLASGEDFSPAQLAAIKVALQKEFGRDFSAADDLLQAA